MPPLTLAAIPREIYGYCATRDVEAVYLQTASASTPIASASSAFASKQVHQNFASKILPVRW